MSTVERRRNMKKRAGLLCLGAAVLATTVAGGSFASTVPPTVVSEVTSRQAPHEPKSPDDPKSIAVKQYRGSVSEHLGDTPQLIVFLRPDGRLTLTMWGSGSCPTVPTDLKVLDRHHVQVTVSNQYKRMCTMDYAPSTSEIALPKRRVDTAHPLTVDVKWPRRTIKVWAEPSAAVQVTRVAD
jgi:hypothetical protein